MRYLRKQCYSENFLLPTAARHRRASVHRGQLVPRSRSHHARRARRDINPHTISRSRKMRCTMRISAPMMTICSDEAAAMVGSPCHWICENRWTGRLVDSGPDRKSAKLISENEMMKAKIAPDNRLDRNSGRVTLKKA